jgi:hypothetical protein
MNGLKQNPHGDQGVRRALKKRVDRFDFRDGQDHVWSMLTAKSVLE